MSNDYIIGYKTKKNYLNMDTYETPIQLAPI